MIPIQKKGNRFDMSNINSKRVIRGWVFFDWANSAYALVIMVAVFPAYFLAVTDDVLYFGSYGISNSVVYAYSVSISYLIVAMMSPVLSGIADSHNSKMHFLKIFTYTGSIACLSLFFFTGNGGDYWLGLIASVIAAIGFAGSLVFYNAYLPEIVSRDRMDAVSALGFSYGYIGSVILLIICLVLIQFHESFGIDKGLATRISFLSVGLWWMGFAQITFNRLPKGNKLALKRRLFSRGWEEIKMVFFQLRQQGNIKSFLTSFFFYSMGVQTVIMLATAFAEKELSFETSELILLVLILQLVAIVGAHLFAAISKRIGNKYSIIIMLVIWTLICFVAYFVQETLQFYILAFCVGLVMGGIQSISRSSYSKIIPNKGTDAASYFSFYEILEKMGIVIGTASFGLIEQLTGGMRNSILALGSFFLIGIILIYRVNFGPKSEQK